MKIHPSAVAITAAGTAVDDGGVMISKVRDWRPSEETFVRVTPKSGE